MKLTEIIKSLDTYEKFLVDIEASNSQITQVKNVKEFFSSYSYMTLAELDSVLKQVITSENDKNPKQVKNKNSRKSLENSELLKAVKLYKKRVRGSKLNDIEMLFMEEFEANNPQIKKVLNFGTQELSDFFYSQDFKYWKVYEIKFILMYFFGDIPIKNKSKKYLIEVLQNQLFQDQYLEDLSNPKKK